MSLEENVKKWVLLDNNIKQLNDQIKSLKQEKSSHNNDILRYISSNNLDNATIKINNGKLKFRMKYPINIICKAQKKAQSITKLSPNLTVAFEKSLKK